MMNLEQQLELVKEDVRNLVFIEDHCIELQRYCVAINPKSISLIKDPYYAVIEMAVILDPSTINLIKNPNDVLFAKALNLNIDVVKTMKTDLLLSKDDVLVEIKKAGGIGCKMIQTVLETLEDRFNKSKDFVERLKIDSLIKVLA